MALKNANVMIDKSSSDIKFEDKEVDRFEAKYPGVKLVRDHYDRESDLDDDWQAYNELPYHLKIIANEKSLFLYGMKSEQIYQKLKKKFLSNGIKHSDLVEYSYKPSKLREADMNILNTAAREYIAKGGYPIITDDIDDIHELNQQWDMYNNQDDDLKKISNDKSIEIYGMNIADMYQYELKKFLRRDLKNSKYDMLQIYGAPSSTLTALTTTLDYTKNDTNDIVEKAIITNEMSNRVNTVVHKTLLNEAQLHIQDKISKTESISVFDANYLLPEEIVNIYEASNLNMDELVNDENFINYSARFFGFKPKVGFTESMRVILDEGKISSDELLRIGWNPILEYTKENKRKSSMRANKVLNDNTNYKFVSLECTPYMYYDNGNPKHGVSIATIQELNKEDIVKEEAIPKAMISFNYLNENWYQFSHGKLLNTCNLIETVNKFTHPEVNIFFVELDESVYKRQHEILSRFNLKDTKISNMVRLMENKTCPDISSPKVFCVKLLESLFDNPSDRVSVYHIYRDLDCTRDSLLRSHNKLFVFEEYDHYLGKNYLTETFNLKHLQEADTLPIEFDQDGNLFIQKRESIDFAAEYQNCHRMLIQYEKVGNLDGMKYNVAKLWYMNILIEEKLHRSNKSDDLKKKLPYYYKTRAHILNDFNKYMGIILQKDPSFNFEDYYRSTPFDKSVLKISKTFLDRLWSGIKALFGFSESSDIDYDISDEELSNINEEYDILDEVSSSPLEFDDEGNMYVNKGEKIRFSSEFVKCKKMLSMYKKAGNIEPMKEYLARVWYIILLLERAIDSVKDSDKFKDTMTWPIKLDKEKSINRIKYYNRLKKNYLKLFESNLTFVLKKDPKFDFAKYYRRTKYDDSSVKFSNNLVDRMSTALSGLVNKILEVIKFKNGGFLDD